MTTKEKILEQAIRELNDKGFANVSLRDIAKALEISQGNLTYHFKTKAILLESIYEKMLGESLTYIMPVGFLTLHHFEEMMLKFYKYQHQYKFFFIDMVQIFRTFPQLGKLYEASVENRLAEAEKLIAYYVETERMKPETEYIDYQRLSHSIWMLSAFWLSQTEILPKNTFSPESPLQHLWQLVLPFFTEKGLAEYEEIRQYRNPEIMLAEKE